MVVNTHNLLVGVISTEALKERIQHLELTYREGHPLVSDEVFDHVYLAELKRREPDHPFLQEIGPEPDFGVCRDVSGTVGLRWLAGETPTRQIARQDQYPPCVAA